MVHSHWLKLISGSEAVLTNHSGHSGSHLYSQLLGVGGAEIKRIVFLGQLGQKVHKTVSQQQQKKLQIVAIVPSIQEA
jgi:hypothetical protein